jgi:hypothetical protein
MLEFLSAPLEPVGPVAILAIEDGVMVPGARPPRVLHTSLAAMTGMSLKAGSARAGTS